MNVILLIIDTLRYDHVGANGNDWIETPNLDSLAGRSWVFDNAYAGSFPTIPHRTDVITGSYGPPFNPWRPLAFDAVTLPRILAEAGYATQLIHDTPHLVNGGHAFDYPFAAWTFVRGAEVDRPWIDNAPYEPLANWARDELFDFLGDPDLAECKHHVIHSYLRANRGRKRPEDWNVAKLFAAAAKFVRDNAGRDNFFLWLDCFDPHEPWDAPPACVLKYDKTPGYDGRIDPRAFTCHRRKDLPEQVIAREKALYAAKVSWVDHWVGELLAALDEAHLTGSTAIIVTSDHGTNLNERPGFGKSFPVWEGEGHVPLIISAPGRATGRSDMFVQPQDIFATILGIAGAEGPDGLDCHDVLSLAEAGAESPRPVALTGRALQDAQRLNPESILFTVFAREGYLLWAPRPQACRLMRYGSAEDVTADDPQGVDQLWQVGLEEVMRRDMPPEVAKWLQGRGETPLPAGCIKPLGPAGWIHYWQRAYRRW